MYNVQNVRLKCVVRSATILTAAYYVKECLLVHFANDFMCLLGLNQVELDQEKGLEMRKWVLSGILASEETYLSHVEALLIVCVTLNHTPSSVWLVSANVLYSILNIVKGFVFVLVEQIGNCFCNIFTYFFHMLFLSSPWNLSELQPQLPNRCWAPRR